MARPEYANLNNASLLPRPDPPPSHCLLSFTQSENYKPCSLMLSRSHMELCQLHIINMQFFVRLFCVFLLLPLPACFVFLFPLAKGNSHAPPPHYSSSLCRPSCLSWALCACVCVFMFMQDCILHNSNLLKSLSARIDFQSMSRKERGGGRGRGNSQSGVQLCVCVCALTAKSV